MGWKAAGYPLPPVLAQVIEETRDSPMGLAQTIERKGVGKRGESTGGCEPLPQGVSASSDSKRVSRHRPDSGAPKRGKRGSSDSEGVAGSEAHDRPQPRTCKDLPTSFQAAAGSRAALPEAAPAVRLAEAGALIHISYNNRVTRSQGESPGR